MLSTIKNRNKSKQSGFTIIEVMIVLAIAGLIMLIIFLAVPALQRNSRNTQIKNDAGNVAGGISTFQSNNNGTMPTSVTGTGSVVITAGTATDSIKVNGSTAVTSVTTAPGSPLTAPTLGTVKVYLGFRCDNTASARAAAVVYATETSGSSQAQCIDS